MRWLILISTLLFFKGLVACQAVDSSARVAVKKAHSVPSSRNNQEKMASDEGLIPREKKIFAQMHTIYSEAWFVISKSRFANPKSIFEYATQQLEKISSQRDSCGVQRVESSGDLLLQDKNCSSGLILPRLQWRWESDSKLLVWFSYGQISELVNIGILEFQSFKPQCQIQVDAENQINTMSCRDIGQAFGENVQSFVFDKLEYFRQGETVVRIQGRTLDLEGDLVKYESEVPAVGDIRVQLTQLRKKAEDPVPPKLVQEEVPKVTEETKPVIRGPIKNRGLRQAESLDSELPEAEVSEINEVVNENPPLTAPDLSER